MMMMMMMMMPGTNTYGTNTYRYSIRRYSVRTPSRRRLQRWARRCFPPLAWPRQSVPFVPGGTPSRTTLSTPSSSWYVVHFTHFKQMAVSSQCSGSPGGSDKPCNDRQSPRLHSLPPGVFPSTQLLTSFPGKLWPGSPEYSRLNRWVWILHQKILRSRKLARHCPLLSLCHPCHRHLALHDGPTLCPGHLQLGQHGGVAQDAGGRRSLFKRLCREGGGVGAAYCNM